MEDTQKSMVDGSLGKRVFSKRRKRSTLWNVAERSSQIWASSFHWTDGNFQLWPELFPWIGVKPGSGVEEQVRK